MFFQTKLNDGQYHGNLVMNVERNDARANMAGLRLDTVDIYGVVPPPEGFSLNIYIGDSTNPHTSFEYDANTQVSSI